MVEKTSTSCFLSLYHRPYATVRRCLGWRLYNVENRRRNRQRRQTWPLGDSEGLKTVCKNRRSKKVRRTDAN